MATRPRKALDARIMRTFTRLREMRAFERGSLPFLRTLTDVDLVLEIGYRQALQAPLKLKEIHLLGLGSPATTQRRLRRLRRLGVVERLRSPSDRRAAQVALTAETVERFARYAELLDAGS
jgi:DNA-binding MarR family transcriptional regulator